MGDAADYEGLGTKVGDFIIRSLAWPYLWGLEGGGVLVTGDLSPFVIVPLT